MKSFLLFCVLAACATSCTTLSNRRDLYNPSKDAGPYNSLQPKKPNAPGGSAPTPEGPLPPSQ